VEAFFVEPVPTPGADALRAALLLDALLPRYAMTAADVPRCLCVAMRLTCAHSLWGYGRFMREASPLTTATQEALAVEAIQGHPQPQEAEWTGLRLAALKEELQLQGVRAPTQEMVKRTGIKEREIRRRINPATPKKKAATPFDGLASVPRKGGRKAA
jgi:hypothetical protein